VNNRNLKITIPGVRVLLYIASILVLSIGSSLYFLSEKTDLYFSWTVNPPLTAAFLGAGYLASFILEFLSARESLWARARPAIPGVWVFTLLTLIITLIHLDRFHFDSPVLITKVGTWVWLFVYLSVPIVMGLLWILQVRQPGIDPERKFALPAWFRYTLIVQGAIMLLFGGMLVLTPTTMSPLWPWQLSALTARAIGAWGVGVGIIALQTSLENDWWRLYPAFLSLAMYGVFQSINLLRYSFILDWSRISTSVYTIFVVSVLIASVFGTWKTRQAIG
jgi:hypothetical protein